MVNILQFGPILAVLENGWIRLVELIKNSVAAGNSGNSLAGSGEACKCGRPRNAKHSSQKQPTFHQNLRLLSIGSSFPHPKKGSSELPIRLNAQVAFSFRYPTSRSMKSCSILAAGESTRFLTVIRL